MASGYGTYPDEVARQMRNQVVPRDLPPVPARDGSFAFYGGTILFKKSPPIVDFPAQERQLFGSSGKENRLFDSCASCTKTTPPGRSSTAPSPPTTPWASITAGGATYKDLFQRFWTMRGRQLRYQNGFDCQGLWWRSTSKKRWLTTKKDIEDSAWSCSCACARRASCATPPCRPSSPSAWATGWTGTDPGQLRWLADKLDGIARRS